MARPAAPSRRLVILLVVTALALMTVDARGFGPVQVVRGSVLSLSEPLRDGVGSLVSPIGDGWNGAVHYDDVVAENARLRAELADLRGEVDGLPDTEQELKSLRRATDLDYIGDIARVAAEVVTDRRTGLERIIELDRGSTDGVTEGMPVVTGSGLVGRITLVTPDRAVVRLINDPRFSVGVVTRFTGAVGVATGDGSGRALVLDLEEASLNVAANGARFTTSGFNRSRYPGGIPVGTLKIASDDERTLEPAVDLSQLRFVSILLVPEP